ncbi:MAG: hypothetical protein JWN37_200 [Candidatus Nomurabacteria bacterium]|nr:hypothetical protein [Candidatus Nomurabacteria bacterium]
MLLLSHTVEDYICEALKEGPISTISLIEKIKANKPGITKQAVYLALRKLKQAEVIVIHNKKVSFNIRWLKNMNDFLRVSEMRHSLGDVSKDNFLNLSDGEKITYSFNNAHETDAFWWQALYMISEMVSKEAGPIYLYNPHEWFLFARRESELELLRIIAVKRRLLILSTHKTPLDLAVAKDFDGNRTQYYMHDKPLFPKNNYYYNVMGDFIIEVYIARQVIDAIEEIYSSSLSVNEEVIEKLKKTINIKGKTLLSISRNKKKAEKLKKEFYKHFYIPEMHK